MILGAAPWVVHADDTIFELLVREDLHDFLLRPDGRRGAGGNNRAGSGWGFRHAWTP